VFLAGKFRRGHGGDATVLVDYDDDLVPLFPLSHFQNSVNQN